MNGLFKEASELISVDANEREQYLIDTGTEEIRYWKNCARSLLLCGFALMICLFISHTMYKQEKELAYQMSAVVTLQEEILFLEYRLLPEDVGLEDLRSEWFSNPCYNTIYEYSAALELVLEYLEQYPYEPAPEEQPIYEVNEPQFIYLKCNTLKTYIV